jgi:hypothetical protein
VLEAIFKENEEYRGESGFLYKMIEKNYEIETEDIEWLKDVYEVESAEELTDLQRSYILQDASERVIDDLKQMKKDKTLMEFLENNYGKVLVTEFYDYDSHEWRDTDEYMPEFCNEFPKFQKDLEITEERLDKIERYLGRMYREEGTLSLRLDDLKKLSPQVDEIIEKRDKQKRLVDFCEVRIVKS